DRPRHFLGRPQEIVDQRVDGALHLAPGAARQAEFYAVARLAFAADDFARAFELVRHTLIGRDDLVEGVGDLADNAVVVPRHAYGEVAGAHGLERVQELVEFRGVLAVRCAVGFDSAVPLHLEHAAGRDGLRDLGFRPGLRLSALAAMTRHRKPPPRAGRLDP